MRSTFVVHWILLQVCKSAWCLSSLVHHNKHVATKDSNGISNTVQTRRHWFDAIGTTTAAMSTFGILLSNPSMVEATNSPATEKLTRFRDDECSFEILVPSTWERTEQRLPAPDRRKVIIFMDPDSPSTEKTLLFLAYTPVRDDFTSLSSFGSADQVRDVYFLSILPKRKKLFIISIILLLFLHLSQLVSLNITGCSNHHPS